MQLNRTELTDDQYEALDLAEQFAVMHVAHCNVMQTIGHCDAASASIEANLEDIASNLLDMCRIVVGDRHSRLCKQFFRARGEENCSATDPVGQVAQQLLKHLMGRAELLINRPHEYATLLATRN